MRALKDSAIYLIGELAARSVPFLLLPYLSRKLGVAGFGELSYYQTYLALFAIVIGLSQDGAIARYFYFYGKRSMGLVIRTGYLYSAVVGMIILLICWLLQSEILMIVALASLFQSFLAVQLSVRQCQKQAVPYALVQLCSTLFSAGLTVLLLEIFDQALVEKRFIALMFSNFAVSLLAYFVYAHRQKLKSFSFIRYKQALFYILGFGLPLILHHVSLFLRGQLDRIFIYHHFSENELGLYAMGAQIAAILMVFIQAINKALVPHFYEGLKTARFDIRSVHKWAWLSLFIVPLPALVMWFLPEGLVAWGLGEQFIGTKYYIVLFLLSTSLVIPYLILVNYLFYYGKNKLISFCSVLSTLVYVGSLISLTQTAIEYVPFASILGAVVILPILYVMTYRVSKTL